MSPELEATLDLPEDIDSIPHRRGRGDARAGNEFNPRYWGYSAFGKMEYDYARGYASVNDLQVAVQTIESYQMATAMPVDRVLVYEDDGDILRAKPRR